MPDIIGLIKDDWLKIPANFRYVFYAGVFLIIAAWLGDHWEDQHQYHLPIFLSNESAFQFGLFIIGLFFVSLIVKQIWLYRKIMWLRRRYPLNCLDKDFNLVNFQCYVYLIDEKRKQRFHVKNTQTAIDLGFLNEWQWVDISQDALPDTQVPLRNGKTIKLGDYPINPAGLHTQGLTAT